VGALILIFGTVVFELAEGIIAIEDTVSETVDGNSFVAVSLSVMIKSLGIAIIGRICADICKECGEGGLAQGVELVSGAVIFSLSLPILSEILGFASDVLSRGA
jgi:stage III sporulation protein AD